MTNQTVAIDPGHPPAAGLRFTGLDSYRFLAASLIVVIHYDTDFRLGLASRFPQVRSLDLFVDFFFVLSGFVIALAYADRTATFADYIDFLQRRVARIYPLHLLTLAMVVGFVFASTRVGIPINNPRVYAADNLLANMFLVHAWGVSDMSSFNVPSWSLSAEQFVYFLFPLFVLAASRLPAVANAALIALIVAALCAVPLFEDGKHWTHANADFGMLRAVPTFFAGVVMARVFTTSSGGLRSHWFAVHGLFAASLVLIALQAPDELVLLTFVGVIYLAAICERDGQPSLLTTPLFGMLGHASFGIYLLHRVVHMPFTFLAKRVSGGSFVINIGIAVAMYACVVVLAILSYRWFETPMRRLLSPRPSVRTCRKLQAA